MRNTLRRAAALGAVVLATLAAQALAAQDDDEQIGSFYLREMVDPMTDEDRSMVFSLAEPDGYRQPSVHWMCLESGIAVVYQWDKYFIGNRGSGASVQFRFSGTDAGPMLTWTIATDHMAAYLPRTMVEAFTALAEQSDELVLRVQDSDGEVLTDVFPLDGLPEALDRLSCANTPASARK